MNFLQCYQLLDLEPGCNWAELQTAYRRLVQKWHPDRFMSHPDQHHLAAQRILEVNEAFEMLARHYSVYGHLPGEPVPTQRSATTAPEPKRNRSPRNAVAVSPTASVGKTPRWLLAIAFVVLGYAVYLAFTDKHLQQQPVPVAFFTHGDIPGKVLEAQGIPTRTEDDVWFYGDSEVHFNKGVVVSWHESPTHPLKAAGAIPAKPAPVEAR